MPKKTKHSKNETQDQILARLKAKRSSSTATFLMTSRPPPPVVEYPSEPNRLYKAPTPQVQVLKASMRFIPFLNNSPKARNDTDPPYLFSVKRRHLSYSFGEEPKRCIPRPPKDDKNYDHVGLECEDDKSPMTQRLKKIRQQLLMAYIDCYNRHQEDAQKVTAETPAAMYGLGGDRGESEEIDILRGWEPDSFDGDADWLGTMDDLPLPAPPPGLPGSALEDKERSSEPLGKKELGSESDPDSESSDHVLKKTGTSSRSTTGGDEDLIRGANSKRSTIKPISTGENLKRISTGENLKRISTGKNLKRISTGENLRRSRNVDRRKTGDPKVESLSRGRLTPLKSKVKPSSSVKAKGKVVPVEWGGTDEAELPAGAVLGYLGENGEFMELLGEPPPEGATRAYLTW